MEQNGDESRANPTSKIFNAPPHTIVTSHTDPSSLENIGLPSIGDEKEASPNSIEQGARSVPDSEVARPKMVNHLPAIAQPANKADLTCLADGPLYELFVKEGQEVMTGDSLALIDNRVALASVSSAQASADRRAMLTSARAKVSLAEQYLQRISNAAAKNAASGLELDEAKSRLDEAKAQVPKGWKCKRGRSKAVCRSGSMRIPTLRAPFTGTITKIHKRLGESIGRDQTLITIVDVRTLRAELFIPVELMTPIRVGTI